MRKLANYAAAAVLAAIIYGCMVAPRSDNTASTVPPPAPPQTTEARSTPARAPVQTLVASGASHVFVWKDGNSMSEGLQLIDAGVQKTNPALVARLLSCFVTNGTRIIITNVGMFSSDVMVIMGPDSGCRGTVDNGFISKPTFP